VYETGRCVTVDLGLGRTYPFDFIVAAVPTPILGADFLRQYGLLPDLQGNQLIDCKTFFTPGCKLSYLQVASPASREFDSLCPDGQELSDIRHVHGHKNVAPDCLGRPPVTLEPHNEILVASISEAAQSSLDLA
jgi:hypothetical protein